MKDTHPIRVRLLVHKLINKVSNGSIMPKWDIRLSQRIKIGQYMPVVRIIAIFVLIIIRI